MGFFLIALLIGFASGYLSGQFGVGGGVVATPGLRLILGSSAGVALGTTLPVIIPSAIAGAVGYGKAGLIDWRLVRLLASSGFFAVIIGASLTAFISPDLLLLATAFLILALGIAYLAPMERRRPPRKRAHEGLVAVVIGFVSGFFSGLLGIGGGFILIPGMTGLLGRRIKCAFGTSLTTIAIYAIPGSLIHFYLGHINLSIMGLLIAGAVPGAYIGSRVSLGMSETLLRRLFGAFLVVVAFYFGYAEAVALLKGKG